MPNKKTAAELARDWYRVAEEAALEETRELALRNAREWEAAAKKQAGK